MLEAAETETTCPSTPLPLVTGMSTFTPDALALVDGDGVAPVVVEYPMTRAASPLMP